MKILSNLSYKRIKHIVYRVCEIAADLWYIHITMPHLLKKIRKKEKIRFMFLLTELASWKTEMLYLAMVKHPRFEPIIGVTTNTGNIGAEKILIEYLEKNGYPYLWIDEDEYLIDKTKADIITFQKPYTECRHPKHRAWNNRGAIYCCFDYSLRTTLGEWNMTNRYNFVGFRVFFENQAVLEDYEPHFNVKGKRLVATGVPMMDQLSRPSPEYPNPWKNKDSRKRIIYAPHHTIANMHLPGVGFSTFLQYSTFLLTLADKYKDQVVFAFKPHPCLYTNLLKYWGKEKTDQYYNEWQNRENCQFEAGAYDGLFKHSDAMIHDCGSFITEYQYSRRPALYLVGSESDHSNMVSLATTSYELHYKASSETQIEEFIQNVIAEYDPIKEARDKFYNEQLMPPHGKTACENIINVILGEAEYKKD